MENSVMLNAVCNEPVSLKVLEEPFYRKGFSPFVNKQTGTWWEYDDDKKGFFDTGIIAQGRDGNDYVITEKDYDTIVERTLSNVNPTLDEKLSSKLPKSPTEWGIWTPDEQAAARERIGIPGDLEQDLTMLRAQLGIFENESDVLGLQVDYKNKTFTRIASAVNLTAGLDFDKFKMYGGRKRCNVSDDGTINAYYGDEGYTEDGSNGQVMVYQPKFYYLVCPLEYDRQETGYGYHLRKVNYYVTDKPRAGFKVHPAFYDKNGNEVDYILMSAYEGCIYDTSANAYLKNDEQVMDASKDKFSSIAGARPATGVSQNLTRPNIEQMAKNRGEGWHSLGIKTASMEQLLMIVEMGMMNLQTAIGQGIVNFPWTTSSYVGVTGSTASLGNGTGRATETTTYEGGVATNNTADGKTSICYRGVENFWGNIWKSAYGVNIWGNGKMAGGMPYICSDFNYAEGKNTDNYEGAGFTVTKANGYISAMGYSTKYDWLFMASECLGNSSLPVGDYTYITKNLNGYRIAQLGGGWTHGSDAGGFYWILNSGVGVHYRDIGGRLVYVPTVTV